MKREQIERCREFVRQMGLPDNPDPEYALEVDRALDLAMDWILVLLADIERKQKPRRKRRREGVA